MWTISFLCGFGLGLVIASWFWLEDFMRLYECRPNELPNINRRFTRWCVRATSAVLVLRGDFAAAERLLKRV